MGTELGAEVTEHKQSITAYKDTLHTLLESTQHSTLL